MLKEQLEAMQQRLAQAERVLQMRKEQDIQLRDSIIMARQQAQRAMGTSLVAQQSRPGQPPLDLSSLNINLPAIAAPIPPVNPARDREVPQLLRRVRELEGGDGNDNQCENSWHRREKTADGGSFPQALNRSRSPATAARPKYAGYRR